MNTDKLDPSLLNVLAQFDQEGKAGLLAHARVLGVDSGAGTPRPPTALVFVHCDQNASLTDLEAQTGL